MILPRRTPAAMRLVLAVAVALATATAATVVRAAQDGADVPPASAGAADPAGTTATAVVPPGAPLIIDSVTVERLRRTPEPLVRALAGVEAGRASSARGLRRAARRLGELPTAARTSLAVRPAGPGRAALRLVADEKPIVPAGTIGWSSVALDAVLSRTVRFDVAAPFAQADLWQPSFLWPRARRRLGLHVALPLPGSRRGVLHVDAFGERQTYARPLAGLPMFEEQRRRVGLRYADWIHDQVRLEGGLAADRLAGRDYLAIQGIATVTLFADHVAAHLRTERWLPRASDDVAHATVHASLDWRSTTDEDATRWIGHVGLIRASDQAPLALWAAAASGGDRQILLRGHVLHHRHVLASEVFGRRLAYGTVEHITPVWRSRYAAVGVAGFVDVARAFDRLDGAAPTRLHIDVGAGLRLSRPTDASQLRLDWGVGLRDGRMRVSAGYLTAWGRP